METLIRLTIVAFLILPFVAAGLWIRCLKSHLGLRSAYACESKESLRRKRKKRFISALVLTLLCAAFWIYFLSNMECGVQIPL